MKSLKKRIISVCSALVLIVVSVVAEIPAQIVFATQDRSGNFTRNYTLSGNNATDIVSVATAQLGRTGSSLGYTEEWCADFATDCARLTGMSASIIPYNYSGRGSCDYLYAYMVNNCSAYNVYGVSTPKSGDIVFFGSVADLTHVAIVEKVSGSTVYWIGGNQGTGSNYSTRVVSRDNSAISYNTIVYILRPNYVERPVTDPKIEISGENYPSNPHTPGNNFGIEGKITSNNKLDRVWGGVYGADGSTKVQFYDYNPNSWTVDLHGVFNNNIIFDNLPIGSYTYKIEARDITGYSKVLFTPYPFTVGEIKPSNVKLSIPKTEYMKGDKIVFTPSGTNVTGGYTIGIDDASGNRLITQTFAVGSTYSTSSLASGNYSAYVTAYNDSGYTDSGRIYFSVGVTATFNANGGSCGTASKRVVTGDKYGDLPTPSWSGHTFVGWYTSASGGSQVTSSTVVTSGANHTLYAHWTEDNYTVIFNKNGGSGSMASQYIARDQSVALNENKFTAPTGYSFLNWNTKPDGSGTSYSNKASVKNLAAGGGSITLYAIWKANNYTIKYDANTGSGSMDSSTMTYDTAANLRKNTFTKTGYSFVSWSDGNGNYYADQASVRNLATSGTVTLWVKWTPNTYKVTLDDGSGKTTSINVTYDGKYSGLTEPVQDGYNFAGWYTAPDGKGAPISAETTVKITSNQTLYAYWSKVDCLITFNANGGISELSQKRVCYDTKYGVLPIAEKQGYEFSGWYLDEGLTQQITADSIVKITMNQEVYAKWEQIKVTVTFDANGGTVDMNTKKVVNGKVYGVLPEAEKDGFEFEGWFTENDSEITSESVVELINDTTVYAKWRLKGDVDADGDVDIDDVKMLQQWLLAVPDATLIDWRASDLCQDERIDVFDLCLLKRMLIERMGEEG